MIHVCVSIKISPINRFQYSLITLEHSVVGAFELVVCLTPNIRI